MFSDSSLSSWAKALRLSADSPSMRDHRLFLLARGLPPKKRLKEMTVEERFWKKVARGDVDSCWLWEGTTDINGYPVFMIEKGNLVAATRFSLQLLGQPVAKDTVLTHACFIRQCMNEAHFRQTSRSAAIVEGRRRRRDGIICGFSHPTVPENIHVEIFNGRRQLSCKMCRDKQFQIDVMVIEAIEDCERKRTPLSEEDLKLLRVMAKEEVEAAQAAKVEAFTQMLSKNIFDPSMLKGLNSCRYCHTPGHNIRKCFKRMADEVPVTEETVTEEIV